MPNLSLPGRLIRGFAAAVAPVALSCLISSPTATSSAPQEVHVIVQATSPDAGQKAVEDVGGRVTRRLPIVDGVAAVVPAVAQAALQRQQHVRAVTPDAAMTVQATKGSVGPPSVYRDVVAAGTLNDTGATGTGVTVALLDTGISRSPDLGNRILRVTDDVTGKTDACENLSGEPSCADDYGHGTFLAGLIAGDGTLSSGKHVGVAPQARLVSIKVAARDGSADVSNVLAGIQWAVTFRQRYGIRVLNLSLGTDSVQSWRTDPLNYAVERAWAAGITVVVAASNRGPAAGSISKPGDDPWVITVGAIDDHGTVPLSDDRLPDFSARGPTAEGVAKPDVVAPGAHLVSLRAAGSAIDQQFTNYVDSYYRSASGTSMSTAVVSGVAAAVLSARPDYTPDRLKYALAATARPDAASSTSAVGRGVVNAFDAALRAPAGLANVSLSRSSGLGSFDASRGTVRVTADSLVPLVLDGLLTAQLLTWDPIGYTTGVWIGPTWYTTTWYATPWLRTSWYGSAWTGHNWEGCTEGATHESDCFYGHNWEGSTWYGAWD